MAKQHLTWTCTECEGVGLSVGTYRWTFHRSMAKQHLSMGNEEADELAGQGREKHPNNLLPQTKRRRVVEWDALGLGRMLESEDLRVTSDVDSGGGGGGSSSVQSDASGDFCASSDGEELFSTAFQQYFKYHAAKPRHTLSQMSSKVVRCCLDKGGGGRRGASMGQQSQSSVRVLGHTGLVARPPKGPGPRAQALP